MTSSDYGSRITGEKDVHYISYNQKDETYSPIDDAVISTEIGDRQEFELALHSDDGPTTLSKIGNFLARGLAGLVGGPLYGAAFIAGGGLSLLLMTSMILIAIPPGLIIGGIGALIGAARGDAISGAKGGFIFVGILTVVPGVFAEMASMLPKAIIYNTMGRLGAGLCAFAITGMTENQQKEKHREDETFEKFDNEHLLDALFEVSFPIFSQTGQNKRKASDAL